jgi:hypothetical protein
MTEHKNIQEAMLAIYSAVGYVQKSHSDGLRYTFASESAFIQSIRPAMIENSVTVCVSKMDSLTQEMYETKNGVNMMRSTVHGIVTFSHVSNTSIQVESYGEGSDSGDKSVNKAMTDMYKYALRQTFMIETGDDPDKDASDERSSSSAQKQKEPAAVNIQIPDKITYQDYFKLTRATLKWSEEKSKALLDKCGNDFEQAFVEAKKEAEGK